MMNFLNQIQITKYPIPVISIIVFIISLIFKFIELGDKSKNSNLSDPIIVKWLSKSHLGFLTPFMDLIGITQFSQPSLSIHPVIIVIMVLGTFITMAITEIFYGRVALILLLLVSTMTISYISDLKYYSCNRGSGVLPSFCCGSVLLYILLASVINIILTNKSIVLGSILHILMLIALVLSDYYSTYKTTPDRVKLCLSINHHASMYIIGFIISLGILIISSKSPLVF